MTPLATRRRPPTGNIVLGIVRIARGRPDGLAQFGDTPQAFLASLAPLIAFPLVGGAMMAASGKVEDAVGGLLATLCALLTPPVLSYELARLWRRQAHWLRFATAFNWCQWLLPLLATVLMLLLSGASLAGMPEQTAGILLIAGLGSYGLWLHWFLARHGLHLPRLRAALLVVLVNLVTVLLVLGPHLLLERG